VGVFVCKKIWLCYHYLHAIKGTTIQSGTAGTEHSIEGFSFVYVSITVAIVHKSQLFKRELVF
jgi:hypothetical protein